MKFGVVIFPGSNCEQDCYYTIQSVLQQPVEYIWHQDTTVKGFDAVVLPGGFAYGDYLRTGALAKFSPVMRAVADFAKKGGIRSEEHTSELQSRLHLVCRLLLEKKKK